MAQTILRETIKKSIYNPEFYRGLAAESFSFSLKYFFSLVIALSLALTVVMSFIFLPRLNLFLRSIAYSLVQVIPDDLVLSLRAGEVAVNQPEPFAIPLPSELRSTLDAEGAPVEHLVVVDTASEFSLERFVEHKTLVWLRRDSIVMGTDQEVRVQGLREVGDVELTQPAIAEFMDTLKAAMRWLSPVLVFGVFAFAFFGMSLALLYFFFGALVVWIIAKVKKVPLRYGQAYRVALHASTAGLLCYAFLVTVFLLPTPVSLLTCLFVSIFTVSWMNLVPARGETTTPRDEQPKTA